MVGSMSENTTSKNIIKGFLRIDKKQLWSS